MKREPRAGVRRAYAAWFAYIIDIIEEIGTAKALDTLSRVIKRRGEADGKALIKRLGVKGGDIDAGLAVYSAFLADCETEHEIAEKGENKVLIRVSKCPIYDAYYGAGIDCNWQAEKMCKTLTLPLINAVLEQVNPNLKVMLKKYRSSSEGYCLEELLLE